MPSKTALVIRATGNLGAGAVKHLTQTGWKVHAFVSGMYLVYLGPFGFHGRLEQ
jgi:hypothetical protein